MDGRFEQRSFVAFICATFDINLVSSVFQFIEDLGNSSTFELYILTVFT